MAVAAIFSQPHCVAGLHCSLSPKPNHQMPALISSFLIVVGGVKSLVVMGVSTHYLLWVCGLLCRFTFWSVLSIVHCLQLFLKAGVRCSCSLSGFASRFSCFSLWKTWTLYGFAMTQVLNLVMWRSGCHEHLDWCPSETGIGLPFLKSCNFRGSFENDIHWFLLLIFVVFYID